MLVEFSVKNFKSIKNEQTLSLVSTKGKEKLDNLLSAGDDNQLLNSAVIYGANASGKSSIIQAFEQFIKFINNSTSYKEGVIIDHYNPFKLDIDSLSEPTFFEIEFYLEDNILYNYNIEFNREIVIKENLYYYPKKQKSILFERIYNEPIKYGDSLKGPKKTIENIVTNNGLFLSRAGSFKDHQLRNVYLYLTTKVIVSLQEVHSTQFPFFQINTNKDIYKSEETKKYVEKFLKFADVGIESIIVKVKNSVNIKFNNDIPMELKERIMTDISLNAYTVHKQNNKGKFENIEFELKEESEGTIKLYSLASRIVNALKMGQVLIIDELNNGLHPLITLNILKIFRDKTINTLNAQLILTTHDTTLLSQGDFRRDQIWFTEKDSDNSTNLFSLAEFEYDKIRKDAPLDKWYLTGRFGALPIIQEYK